MIDWWLRHALSLATEVAFGMVIGVAWSWFRHPATWLTVQSAEPVHDLMRDYWDGYPAEWFDGGWGGWRPSLTEILPDAKPVPW